MYSSIDNHNYESTYTSVNSNTYVDPVFAKTQELENGRIRLTNNSNENGTPFFVQERVTQDDKTNYYNAMKHTFQASRLSNCSCIFACCLISLFISLSSVTSANAKLTLSKSFKRFTI